MVQLAFVIGTIGGLLVWTYFYDVEMIHSWLDTGLDKQLSLLHSIRNGHLGDTPAGKYLESVRDAFPPEDFFDIICYVQLHVELSVASRSRVMVQRLGKAARMTITPIVKFDPAEYKALEDLRTECRKN